MLIKVYLFGILILFRVFMIDGSVKRRTSTSASSESAKEIGLKRGRSRSEIATSSVILPKLDLRSARIQITHEIFGSARSVTFESDAIETSKNVFQKSVEESLQGSSSSRSSVRFENLESDQEFEEKQASASSSEKRKLMQRKTSAIFEESAYVRSVFSQVLKDEIIKICESIFTISNDGMKLKFKDENQDEFKFKQENLEDMKASIKLRLSKIAIDKSIFELYEREITKNFEVYVTRSFENQISSMINNQIGPKIRHKNGIDSIKNLVVKYILNDVEGEYKRSFSQLMNIVLGSNPLILQARVLLGDRNEAVNFEEGIERSDFERATINQVSGALEAVLEDESKISLLTKFLFDRHKYFFLIDSLDKLNGVLGSRFATILEKSYRNLLVIAQEGSANNILDVIKCEVEVLDYLTKRLSFKGFVIWPNEKQDSSVVKSPRSGDLKSPRSEEKMGLSYTIKLEKWVQEAFVIKSKIIESSAPAIQ